MSSEKEAPRPGVLKRLIAKLRRPSTTLSLGTLLIGGFVAGIVFWGGFHTTLAYTNTEEFCIGCHEMRENVYKEYQNTVHYTNRTGVRAVCSDCHVPKEWGPMMVRKVQASRELWGWAVGTIDTPEKFQAKRLHLARREWARMMANESLECRNCHDFESMAKEEQKPRATREHLRAVEEGMSCIQCHQGIAHELSEDMTDEDYLN